MSAIVNEIRSDEVSVSIELFPPKTRKLSEQLNEEVGRIHEGMRVAFTSVTYGAGGGTQDGTLSLVLDLAKRFPGRVVAHLTCVGADEKTLAELLSAYRENGMTDIMALRGDLPEGMSREQAVAGGYRYAIDLVRWLRELEGISSIGVACYPEGHPETADKAQDIEHFVAKAKAGADYAATQFFFNNGDYLRFVDECEKRGVEIPVAAGILPVRDVEQVVRFAGMCGASVPGEVISALAPYRDDAGGFKEKSADLAATQIQELIDSGVRHFHLYSLNKSDIVLRVADRLGWCR